jgi:dipeptidyl aminopeptidase/acylaminoacyl peptidase
MKLILFTIIFLVGLVIISLWNFFNITRPQRIEVGLKPENFNIKYESVTLKTKDNLTLSAWYIAKKDAVNVEDTPAIILLHGYPAEKSDLLPLATSLNKDFALLLLDFRYFGQSEGRATTLGAKEILDVQAGLDFLVEKGHQTFGVFGFSLGGAVALLTSAQDERIKAAAAHAPFADLKTLGRDLYKPLWILKYPLVELISMWGQVLMNMDSAQISPAEAAKQIKTPVLIIHDEKDDQIPFHHAEHLKQALEHNSQAEFYFYDLGNHNFLPPDFDKRINEFFLKTLGV